MRPPRLVNQRPLDSASERPSVAPGGPARRIPISVDTDLQVPLTIATRYATFLSRRPISSSNRSFLVERVAGLRSLADLLEERPAPLARRATALIRELTPFNVGDIAADLASLLALQLPIEMPRDVTTSFDSPGREFLAHARRVRLVLGPAIGIGDEIICTSFPRWLQSAAPNMSIEVHSTRPDVWENVAGVGGTVKYRTHVELVSALRVPEGDIVLLADFEKPALSSSLAREGSRVKYIELSLGAGAMTVFDGSTRRLHQLAHPQDYFSNYYAFAEQAMAWLGTPASLRDEPRRTWTPRFDRPGFTIAVSPFTSKCDPSEAYWSSLLGGLLAPAWTASARILIEPGPNLATARFAETLARATRARASTPLSCEVASAALTRTLGLGDALTLFREADLVVCADTYAAHAAPASGCPTFVVAGPALERWRVPSGPVFYFSEKDAATDVARGMRRILQALDPRFADRFAAPWSPAAAERVVESTLALASALGANRGARAPWNEYHTCSAEMHAAVSSMSEWPADFGSIVSDTAYDFCLPRLHAGVRGGRAANAAAREHMRHLLIEWESSNVYKYLSVALANALRQADGPSSGQAGRSR